jgi:hypothetical protein
VTLSCKVGEKLHVWLCVVVFQGDHVKVSKGVQLISTAVHVMSDTKADRLNHCYAAANKDHHHALPASTQVGLWLGIEFTTQLLPIAAPKWWCSRQRYNGLHIHPTEKAQAEQPGLYDRRGKAKHLQVCTKPKHQPERQLAATETTATFS